MYVIGKFIGERSRLISEILEMIDNLGLEWNLVNVYIEKGFDSVNHCRLISVPKKFGSGTEFIKIKTLHKNQK